jgi:hypothetical protein
MIRQPNSSREFRRFGFLHSCRLRIAQSDDLSYLFLAEQSFYYLSHAACSIKRASRAMRRLRCRVVEDALQVGGVPLHRLALLRQSVVAVVCVEDCATYSMANEPFTDLAGTASPLDNFGAEIASRVMNDPSVGLA